MSCLNMDWWPKWMLADNGHGALDYELAWFVEFTVISWRVHLSKRMHWVGKITGSSSIHWFWSSCYVLKLWRMVWLHFLSFIEEEEGADMWGKVGLPWGEVREGIHQDWVTYMLWLYCCTLLAEESKCVVGYIPLGLPPVNTIIHSKLVIKRVVFYLRELYIQANPHITELGVLSIVNLLVK